MGVEYIGLCMLLFFPSALDSAAVTQGKEPGRPLNFVELQEDTSEEVRCPTGLFFSIIAASWTDTYDPEDSRCIAHTSSNSSADVAKLLKNKCGISRNFCKLSATTDDLEDSSEDQHFKRLLVIYSCQTVAEMLRRGSSPARLKLLELTEGSRAKLICPETAKVTVESSIWTRSFKPVNDSCLIPPSLDNYKILDVTNYIQSNCDRQGPTCEVWAVKNGYGAHLVRKDPIRMILTYGCTSVTPDGIFGDDLEDQEKLEPQQVIDDEHTSSSKQFIVELTDEKSTDLLCPDRTNVSVTVALLTAPHRPDEGSCSKSMASSVDVTYGIAQHCVTGNICSIAATKNDLANAAGHAGFGRLMVAYECKRWPPGGTDGSSSSAETEANADVDDYWHQKISEFDYGETVQLQCTLGSQILVTAAVWTASYRRHGTDCSLPPLTSDEVDVTNSVRESCREIQSNVCVLPSEIIRSDSPEHTRLIITHACLAPDGADDASSN